MDSLVTRHINRVSTQERSAAKHLHPKRSWWYHTAEYNKPKLCVTTRKSFGGLSRERFNERLSKTIRQSKGYL